MDFIIEVVVTDRFHCNIPLIVNQTRARELVWPATVGHLTNSNAKQNITNISKIKFQRNYNLLPFSCESECHWVGCISSKSPVNIVNWRQLNFSRYQQKHPEIVNLWFSFDRNVRIRNTNDSLSITARQAPSFISLEWRLWVTSSLTHGVPHLFRKISAMLKDAISAISKPISTITLKNTLTVKSLI